MQRLALLLFVRLRGLETTAFQYLVDGSWLELGDFVLCATWPLYNGRILSLGIPGAEDNPTVTG